MRTLNMSFNASHTGSEGDYVHTVMSSLCSVSAVMGTRAEQSGTMDFFKFSVDLVFFVFFLYIM